jgi:hypothetical protein
MKKCIFLSFVTCLILSSCQSKVNPSEWVVSTATCWNTMTVSKAGDVIPRLYSTCDRMVILPATFMSMEFKCDTKFAGKVQGSVAFTGQWRISDPQIFIQNAKSITSSNTTDGNKIDVNALEELENGVVDKMLIDLLREYTPDKEPGIDELQIERDLAELARTKLSNRGVEFANTSINVVFSPQTEEALDAISALKFYRINNEEEFGRQIILNKALSPKLAFTEVKE